MDLEQRVRWRITHPDARLEDRVVAILQDAGELTKHELYVALANSVRRAELNRALLSLESRGAACMRAEPSGGRPREVWSAVRARHQVRMAEYSGVLIGGL
jgi:hypothetical protein